MRRFLGLLCPLLLLPLTACNPIDRVVHGCKAADENVVSEIMESVDLEGREMDRIELVRAKVVDLPDDLQEFDFDQLMAINTAQWSANPEPDTHFPGAEVTTTFALDSGTGDVAPINDVAVESFTLTNPVQEDQEWDDWVESITESDPYSDVSGCARSH